MARISIAGMAAFLIPLGVLEFLVYCRFVGVPVPVDVYSVAGTAIILAVFSLFAFVLVAVCACMPAFLLMWFVRPKTYHNIAASCLFGMSFGWARKGDPVESMRRVTQFKFLVNYVLLSIIPLMVFYLAYWSESMIVFVVWMAFAMLAPLIFGLSFFKYSVAVPHKSYMDRLFFYGIAYVYQIYYILYVMANA